MDGFDILKARKQAKLSQRALAKELGLTGRVSLGDIESGAIHPTEAWCYKAIAAVQRLAESCSAASRCQEEAHGR